MHLKRIVSSVTSLGEINKHYAKVVNYPASKGIFSTLNFKEIFAALEEIYSNSFKMVSLLVRAG